MGTKTLITKIAQITTIILVWTVNLQAQDKLIGSCWTGHLEDAWKRQQKVHISFQIAHHLPLQPNTKTPVASIHIPDFVFAEDLKTRCTINDETISFGTNYGVASLMKLDSLNLVGFIPHKSDSLVLHLKKTTCPTEPPAIRTKELTIDVGELDLGGTLFLPIDSTKPVSCAIFVHGKKCRDRTRFMSRAKKLAEDGTAAFVFDKRGSPPTGFDPFKTTLDQHATDLARIMEFLSVESQIDPYKIGLIAYSTGGWVSPLSTQKTRVPLAFLVSVVGPAISTEVYSKHWFPELIWRKTNQSRQAKELASEYINWAYSNLNPIKKAQEMNSILRKAQKDGWANFIEYEYEVRTQHDLPKLWTTRHMYDPQIQLARLRCPVLSILGEADWVMPAELNHSAFKRAFLEAGKGNFQIIRIPNADHSMKVVEEEKEGVPPEIFTRLAPESWFGIIDFLTENEFLPKSD